MSHCKVAYCRFNWSHVTKGHKCGVCGHYGHGEIECYHTVQKNMLVRYHTETLPDDKKCTVPDCEYKDYHTKDAHHCSKCKQRVAHSVAECVTEKTIKCPICRTEDKIKNPTKIFGLTDKCAICLENNVEVFFTKCNHCCVCVQCFDKM